MGDVIVGPLARSILMRHRAGVWAVMVRILERAKPESSGTEGASRAIIAEGILVEERELARQTITDGRWVTLGVVVRGTSTVFVDIDILSGDARLVIPPADWSPERPWNGAFIPAAELEALARSGGTTAPAASGPTDRTFAARTTVPAVAAVAGWSAPPLGRVTVNEVLARLLQAADRSSRLCRWTEELLDRSAQMLAEANLSPAKRAARLPEVFANDSERMTAPS
jgi:hypothetical protein